MKVGFRLLSLGLVSLLMSACAFTPQKVTLNPRLSLSEQKIGKGKSVVLVVVDERPKKNLGHRGTAYGPAAEISTDQDVATVVRDKVAEGLRAYDFVPLPQTGQSPVSMKVEVRLIEYTTTTGFFSGGIETRAALKVVCKNGDRVYENLYRKENEQRVFIVPFAEQNADMINQVVSQTIDSVLQDQELLAFLSH